MSTFNETMRQEILNRDAQELKDRVKSLEDKVDEVLNKLVAMQSKPVKVVKPKKSEAA